MSKQLSKRLQSIARDVFYQGSKKVKTDLWDFTFSKYKEVRTTSEEREFILKESLSKVEYPIMDLCEYLLDGVNLTRIDKGTYRFTAGEDFTIKEVYHFNIVSLILSPDITQSYEESSLVESCLREAINDSYIKNKKDARDKVGMFLGSVL